MSAKVPTEIAREADEKLITTERSKTMRMFVLTVAALGLCGCAATQEITIIQPHVKSLATTGEPNDRQER